MTKEELRQEFIDHINDLESMTIEKYAEAEFDWFYSKIEELEAKLEAAEQVYYALESTGLKWPNIVKALEHYKSLK